MQSEAGAAGAIHGAFPVELWLLRLRLRKGLMLMVPNMFKDRR
jgi:hypothetical protein